ncbi:DUF983 domain-containing protein [Mucilaginibacter myungsuensis]|uniref:DUF983 domain-containing protein n=1 Tax=Mucilaginibacter myungsuensis TaxID=649104 RepID=A0A929KXC9_9SPHI|nr:DUF983 domain-containing protein [Mucilaginibacter myungsuensis]MBE9662922.1 DUF983 domain-containing protein [Mucilaginibacter myungsuensis]MDN3598544.1 DUF983 domain-containing protein [Mucilaginibacter myungsuensis]
MNTVSNNNKQLSLVPGEFKSALHAKCPKCRTGNMFANGMYSFSGQQMHKECPHCNYRFEVEPGYFYVAMFVSYAMNVALLVTMGVGTYILTHSENPWLYLATLLIPAFAASPISFRYSRVILLYWLTPGLHFDIKRMAGNK